MTQRVRTFHYVAYTQAGALAEGRVEAGSLDEARETLWGRGLVPFETREDRVPSGHRGLLSLSPGKPSRRDVTSFTREFATLVQSGIALDDALRIIAEQSITPRMRLVVAGLLAGVLDGAHLSDTMARHPDVFADDYVNMVRAGEASGDVARVFAELSDLLERREALAGKLSSALIYPCVLIVMALASVAVVIGVLVPGLAPIFAESGRPMPAFVGLLVALEQAWPFILMACVGVAAGALMLAMMISRSAGARRAADRLLLRFPFVGTLSAEYELARFARTLGSLLRAGVPLIGALTSAGALVRNSHVASGVVAALEQVRDGQSLGRALAGRPGISSLAVRMITVGEETGKLAHMLLRIALTVEQQSQRRIERLMTLLTPALTIAIATLVGALILTVMNAILSVNELAVR